MIELKSPAEIERMHTTGQFVAQILSEVGERAEVASTSSTWNVTSEAGSANAARSPATGTTPRPSATARSAT